MTVEVDPRRARGLPFVIAWLVMLLLAGLSLWTAFLEMGIWAPMVQYGIAAVQTSILFILFMRLKGPPSLKWIFAISGFFWLLFLYGLSMTDYADRKGWPLSRARTGVATVYLSTSSATPNDRATAAFWRRRQPPSDKPGTA